MNNTHLQQIFANYIERFEELNNAEHQEYFKWQVAKQFQGEMDQVLSASRENLPAKLREVRKLTFNLIDNFTQPFYGLSKMAEEEPDTVREMFLNLYQDDGGDLSQRQRRITDFLNQSEELRKRYYSDSFLYKNDFHSVTGYLFLYDPDHNYLYKATECKDVC